MLKPVRYGSPEADAKIGRILSRGFSISPEVEDTVEGIIEEVRTRGDEAIFELTLELDRVDLRHLGLRVSDGEIKEARESADPQLVEICREAISNVRKFHEKQKAESWFMDVGSSAVLGKRVVPMDSVAVYVPGGRFPLFSSLIMGVVPAKVAGVGKLFVATPPGRDGSVNSVILALARELGVDGIYRIGGAQAIAAFAFGTSIVPKVSKIVGPGNAYVVAAKRAVFGTIGIEMLPGPSEIVIIADESANPEWIAADMLSQAEHDVSASGVLITPSEKLSVEVSESLNLQLSALPTREVAERSLGDYGAIIIVENLDEGCELANIIAPEHLEIVTASPWDLLEKITNAGAVFIGPFSPEPVGDYYAGTNHILPTGGTARFSSSLGVSDFVKSISVVAYTESKLLEAGRKVVKMAEAEGLIAHARSVGSRLKKNEN